MNTDTATAESRRALLEARLRGGLVNAGVGAGTASREPIPPHSGPVDCPPLSFAQERLWFLDQLTPDSAAYTLPIAVRIRGCLDEPALHRALAAVVERHEPVRTVFPADEDGAPSAHVTTFPVTIETADFDDLDVAWPWLTERGHRPFDLAAGPLLRAYLARLGDNDHVLLLAVHHIVCDGSSAGLLLRDLWDYYRSATGCGSTELSTLPVRYGDVAAWQRDRMESAQGRADLAAWCTRLAGTPVLDLPTDRPRPAEIDYAGAWHTFQLGRQTALAVEALARATRTTPFIVLLAAYRALLGRWSGQSDFAIGSPVAGRGHPDTEQLVGMFVNTVALRVESSGDPTFRALVGRTAAVALEAYEREHVPFERIVSQLALPRDTSRTPVFQTTLALQNYERPVFAEIGLAFEAVHLGGTQTHADLALYAERNDEGLSCTFTYRTALFDEASTQALGRRFSTLIEQVTTDPDLSVSEIVLTSPQERRIEVAESTGDPVPEAPAPTLHGLVEAQISRVPDNVAVVCNSRSATYAQLGADADRIARRLRALGAGTESRVGVLLEQSVELAAAVLGVLKAGAAYVPLDPEQPAERLAVMTEDCGMAALVTTSDLLGKLKAVPDDLVLLDVEPTDLPADAETHVDPANLAYVIYTSGSTGRPKGVAVAHRQAVNYVAAVSARIPIEPGARHLLMQSLSFDFGLTLFYSCLAAGGALHLLPPRSSGRDVADYIRENRIDYLKLTPSHFEALTADAGFGELLPAKALLFGGEGSVWSRTRELAATGVRIVNHYGPTEATVGVATQIVDPSIEPITTTTPIGRPLPGACVYVLDEAMEPVPRGAVGELYLGGDRLARGYLGRPGQTADRFVPDPFGPPGARMYRSGDLGRRLPDGSIEFLGRRDLQVKIRGYRVEPGEIEAALAALPGVRQAVVDVRGTRAEPMLIGYLVRAAGPEPLADADPSADEAALRRALRDHLPDYMVPARLVWLDALPLADHGKVDRRALPEPPARAATGVGEPPSGPVEEQIARIFEAVLGLASVGADDDFFEIGGHSLLAVRVVAKLRALVPEGQRPPGVMDLFKAPTVRTLAALLADPSPAGDDRPLIHRLTPARPAGATAGTVVCAPYGGGSALIYKPLADVLPDDWALYSIAVPGHELGEQARPIPEVAADCVREILAHVQGPLVLYGHCGLGVMLTVEIARLLQEAGRLIEAVYLGGIFPFARTRGPVARLAARMSIWRDGLRSDRWMVNALAAAGLDVEEIDPEQLALIVRNRRDGTREAEAYFGTVFTDPPLTLDAPVIAVIGERDPAGEFYQERYREWLGISATAGLVVLDEAGHFFLRYRAGELAEIVTGVHRAIAEPQPIEPQPIEPAAIEPSPIEAARAATEPPAVRDDPSWAGRYRRMPGSTWWLHAVARGHDSREADGVQPSMGRFLSVAGGQTVSMLGSALTEFAIPIWVFARTGSLARFALFSVVALVPGILAAPIAGTVADRFSRKRVMLLGDGCAGLTQAALAVLYFSGHLQPWHIYVLLGVLSLALTFQRLAYTSSVAQLAPKRYLGQAIGFMQTGNGLVQFFVPLVAIGVLAAIGLGGILAFDVVSYLFAIGVTAYVRFPDTLGWRRRETVGAEIREGFRFSAGNRGLRALLLLFAAANVFLAPMLVMVSPLVLSFAPLHTAAVTATFSGAGVAIGGFAILAWGGPREHRMRAVLAFLAAFAVFGAIAGARPSAALVAAGGFGMALTVTLMNGVYMAIVLVKVPLRFHGRVFALNTLVAWSTIPLANGVLGPLTARWLARAAGVSAGRGIGLSYELFAALLLLTVLIASRIPAVARFDSVAPDAQIDDEVGLAALAASARIPHQTQHDFSSTKKDKTEVAP
ncbi:non-ribosomal peptide synthetase/MFS transporter [Actinospica robiniae]|uniref:non-ribosomal peptide synthetase/MFS transporter n=1 Tax=Actinospica robiniae TaxID=304901 RepID=UPI0004268D08|nr:non-ribosomal peptide synthetase/MFS transporter [Actinospica robiniae]